MFKKFHLFICFIAIACNCVIAQEETNKTKSDKYLEFSPSLHYINLSNPRHSIVRYSGLGYSVNLGLQIEKPEKREGFCLNFLKGLTTSENELNTTSVLNLAVSYFHERKIMTISEKTNWFLGADLSTFLNLRQNLNLGNNQMFYDFVQDLRLSTSIRKELSLRKRKLYLDYRLKLPLIAMISRPPKAIFVKDSETEDIMPTSKQLTKNMFTNGKFAFAGKYNNMQSNFTVWMPFKKNSNRVGFSYVWDLYTYRDYFDKKQVMGSHSVKFTLLTKL